MCVACFRLILNGFFEWLIKTKQNEINLEDLGDSRELICKNLMGSTSERRLHLSFSRMFRNALIQWFPLGVLVVLRFSVRKPS